MDKRKIGYVTIVIIYLCSVFWEEKIFAEDLIKKPFLKLPEVNIVGKKKPDYVLVDKKDVQPEEFDLKSEEENDATGQESTGYLTCAFGRFQSNLCDLKQSARTENFYYTFQASINDSNGERQNSYFTIYRPRLNLGLPLDLENELVFRLNYFDKIMGLPGKVDEVTLEAKRRTSNFESLTSWTYNTDFGQIGLEPYYSCSAINEDITRPNFKNKVAGMRLNIEADENMINFDLYKNRLLNYYEQMIFKAHFGFAPLQLSDNGELFLGMNVFAQERFGQRPAPFLEIIFKKTKDYMHKIKINREFEPLDFSQTYLDLNYAEVNPAELRPKRETSISYEIDKYISNCWRTNFNLYVGQDKDLWFFNDADNNGLYAPTLMDKVNLGGIRLSTEYNWSEQFSQFLSINVRKMRSKDSNYEFVPFEPKQRLSAGLTYKPNKKLKIDMVGDYFGRQLYSGNSKETLKGYFLLGSKLNYEFKDYLTLFILVDNLLNDHYDIIKGYPSQGRSALAGATVKF